MSFGRCRRSLGKPPAALQALHSDQLLTTTQDHHGTLCSCICSGLWRHHQPVPVHLRESIRLHNEDRTAGLAHLHRVSHYETEVRHSARPILPIPVRQRSRARVVALRAAGRLPRVHYVRWLGHSRKCLPLAHLCIAFCRSLATEHHLGLSAHPA